MEPIYKALICATQAVDLVRGGESLTLPEEARAGMYHRSGTQRSFSTY